jgi:hypothetical protein
MHDKAQRQPDGSLVMPAYLVERWELQMNTSYENLTPAEKDSDREQVSKYFPILNYGCLRSMG